MVKRRRRRRARMSTLKSKRGFAAILGSMIELGTTLLDGEAAQKLFDAKALGRGALMFVKNFGVDVMSSEIGGGLVMETVAAALLGEAGAMVLDMQFLQVAFGSMKQGRGSGAAGSLATLFLRKLVL